VDTSKKITTTPVTPIEKGKEVTPTVKGKGAFTVQVSSWRRRSDAEKQVALLGKHGYDVYIEEAVIAWKGGKWYRVRVGHYETEKEALKDASAIKNLLGQDAVVTK